MSSLLNPQAGLEQMVDSLMANPQQDVGMLDPFISAGASLTLLTPRLFAPISIKTMREFQDAAVPAIEVCATIMDRYWHQMDHTYVQTIADWSAVVPKFWAYIGMNAEPRDACLSYLKCCSDYLRGTHTLHATETERAHAKELFMQRIVYDDDVCRSCGTELNFGCRCDDAPYDSSHCPTHYCGDEECDGRCGVLVCGCIDVCRCRSRWEENW